MHELALVGEVVDALSRHAGARRVRSATVRVGGHPVDPADLSAQLVLVAAGTAVEGAEVQLIVEPFRARCRVCGNLQAVGEATDLVACRTCGGLEMEALCPEGCVVEALELDDCDGGEEGRAVNT